MVVAIFVYFILCSHFSGNASINVKKQNKFEVLLESAKFCTNVNPPFAKKTTILSKYSINVVNGQKLLSGSATIIAPTPLLNLSARTYTLDKDGRRQVVFQMTQASCRNILAKTMIAFGNVSINSRTCMLRKGFYPYENLDLNKIGHALPGWHHPGIAIYEIQMVSNGATDLCHEVTVNIRSLK